MVRYTVYCI